MADVRPLSVHVQQHCTEGESGEATDEDRHTPASPPTGVEEELHTIGTGGELGLHSRFGGTVTCSVWVQLGTGVLKVLPTPSPQLEDKQGFVLTRQNEHLSAFYGLI